MSSAWRKAYYGTLGVQVVDVAPQVENAMNEDVLDIDKLQKLCYWVRIPHHFRTRVWNVLLGVRPTLRDLWGFVDAQHEQLYGDLREAARYVFAPLPEGLDETVAEVEVMVRMAILQYAGTDQKRSHARAHMANPSSPSLRHLYHIARAMLSICDKAPIPAFWLFLAFLRSQSGRAGHFPPVAFSEDLAEQTKSVYREVRQAERILTEQGGEQGRVVKARLAALGVKLDELLVSTFMASFADIFPDQCLERIWDIVLGGSRDIFAYVACALLIALRRKLEEATDPSRLIAEMRDRTASSGIDMDAVTQTSISLQRGAECLS
ncbi:hypothetical protein DFJ74DRAFT_711963 [Hyaloraphidium curvatum]|nr:hypothetical protein DFJ74DRAFT_711963 [Hyaloraphidium curvatum]